MIIVSLTTTAQRLHLCRIALLSLISQSLAPDKILVWVSKEGYLRDKGFKSDDAINMLLKELQKKGSREIVEFKWVENTGPYRKLIPALNYASEIDIIVTADDDIFYGEKWLEILISEFNTTSSKVVAARVRKVTKGFLGRRSSYILWPIVNRVEELKKDYVITFGGGVALKKEFFSKSDLKNGDYKKLCPTADDLWYSKIIKENEIVVRTTPKALSELYFIQHDDGLVNNNFNLSKSFFGKVKAHVLDKIIGYAGLPVCGNDISYRKLEKYFEKKT